MYLQREMLRLHSRIQSLSGQGAEVVRHRLHAVRFTSTALNNNKVQTLPDKPIKRLMVANRG